MKAIVRDVYGPPDVLRLEEVERPVPAADEVLVAVRAVSLNASDVESLLGRPLYARIWGLRRPKYRILGSDIAGVVEAVGKDVTRFAVGDAVFGDDLGRWGGLAEYASVPEKMLLAKPDDLSFEVASALPQAGLVALQGIRDKGEVQSGQRVLINGAGGGSGTFAIQIAKDLGAEVTGVDSGEKLDLMRSLGADHVIDYTREDFTANGVHYDLVLDLVAAHSLSDYRRSLGPRGRYLMVGGSVGHLFRALFYGLAVSTFGRRKMGVLAVQQNRGLADLVEMVQAEKIRPVIDRQFPLNEAAEALRLLTEGRVGGKVVITLQTDDQR